MPGLLTKVYECSVTGVSEADRLLSAKSRTTVFQDISYVLPYISANGSGYDCVPQTGDKCLVLATEARGSRGRMAFVIGFQVPPSRQYEGLELGGRRRLPPGSMAIRAVTEDGNVAEVVCSSGGTVLVSSNETCRTLYSPVDNSVSTLFENFMLTGPGGHVRWRRDGQSVTYDAEYRTNTTLADERTAEQRDNDMIVRVRIGGAQNDPLDIDVTKEFGGRSLFRFRVDTNGEAWIEGESLNIIGRVSVNIDAPNLIVRGRPVLAQEDPI